MPIHTSYKSLLEGLRSQYKKGETKCRPMSDGSSFCMSDKAWSIFYAMMNKRKKDETKEMSLCPEDVEEITPKVFNKKKKRKLKELSFKQLEFYHALAHSKFGEIGDKACKLHFKVASEMIRRGAIHVRRSLCDGVVELIHSWRDYDPHGVDNAVLRDDWRIVKAWLHTLKSGTKFESKQFEGMTIEQQRKAVHHLGTIIRREMIKRGWKPKAVVAPK